MSALLVYANQLYRATLSLPKQNMQVVLVEDSFHFSSAALTDELLQYRASMQAFRERLLVKGYKVSYVEIGEIDTLPQILQDAAGQSRHVAGYSLATHPLAKARQSLIRHTSLKFTELPTPGIYFTKEYMALQFPVLKRSLPELPEFGDSDRYVQAAAEYIQEVRPHTPVPVQRLPIAYSDASELVEHAVVSTAEATRKLIQSAVAWCLYQGLLTPAAIAEIVAEYGAFHRVQQAAQERLLRFLMGDTEYRWLRRGR